MKGRGLRGVVPGSLEYTVLIEWFGDSGFLKGTIEEPGEFEIVVPLDNGVVKFSGEYVAAITSSDLRIGVDFQSGSEPFHTPAGVPSQACNSPSVLSK
jgi:hypothetical protein